MRIEIITLFPEIFGGFLSSSLLGKAQENGLISIGLIQLRDFADPPHFNVDDTPYGGGAGMVMRPEPLGRAIEEAKRRLPAAPVILLSAAGKLYKQDDAVRFSKCDELILVCGRYEGVDQRVIDLLIDEEVSIGDYVLMGGEVAAMVLIESAVRLVDNIIGNADSLQHESFAAQALSAGMLEAPQYTRPPEYRGLKVPEMLLSGNHARIEKWRKEQSLELTRKNRPDLIKE